MSAEHTARIMTDWATDIVKNNSNPALTIAINANGNAQLYVNKDLDPAKIVLILRTIANQFEQQEAKKQGIII